MALGPIGNTVYVNQQTPFVATVKADYNSKIDFYNTAAQHIVNEKEKEVEEVRPTEENHQIDPDREHQKNEMDQERENEKNSRKKHNENEKNNSSSLHQLDIKV
jgi:PAS domain-containing protein